MFKLFKSLFFLATLNCRTLNKNDVIISINICHFFVAARFSCLSFIFFQHFFIVYISKKMHACEFIQFIYFQLLFNICIYLFWKSIYFSFRKVIFLIDSINLSYCVNAEKSNILHAAAAATCPRTIHHHQWRTVYGALKALLPNKIFNSSQHKMYGSLLASKINI